MRPRKKISVGNIYESCGNHPVLCTKADEWEVSGISLFDGSEGHSCSIEHCNPKKMTSPQVALRIRNRDLWLVAIAAFRCLDSFDPTACRALAIEEERELASSQLIES